MCVLVQDMNGNEMQLEKKRTAVGDTVDGNVAGRIFRRLLFSDL
jgi:hypothetical protein